jgi:hypothetical protein
MKHLEDMQKSSQAHMQSCQDVGSVSIFFGLIKKGKKLDRSQERADCQRNIEFAESGIQTTGTVIQRVIETKDSKREARLVAVKETEDHIDKMGSELKAAQEKVVDKMKIVAEKLKELETMESAIAFALSQTGHTTFEGCMASFRECETLEVAMGNTQLTLDLQGSTTLLVEPLLSTLGVYFTVNKENKIVVQHGVFEEVQNSVTDLASESLMKVWTSIGNMDGTFERMSYTKSMQKLWQQLHKYMPPNVETSPAPPLEDLDTLKKDLTMKVDDKPEDPEAETTDGDASDDDETGVAEPSHKRSRGNEV